MQAFRHGCHIDNPTWVELVSPGERYHLPAVVASFLFTFSENEKPSWCEVNCSKVVMSAWLYICEGCNQKLLRTMDEGETLLFLGLVKIRHEPGLDGTDKMVLHYAPPIMEHTFLEITGMPTEGPPEPEVTNE